MFLFLFLNGDLTTFLWFCKSNLLLLFNFFENEDLFGRKVKNCDPSAYLTICICPRWNIFDILSIGRILFFTHLYLRLGMNL